MAIRVPLKRDASRSVLPDGVYEVVVEEVEDKEGKESGIPYMNLRLSVRKNERPVGGSIWDIISMSENAAFRLANFLDAVGAPEDGDVSSQWFKGKKAFAKLITDTYNDEPRNKVKSYLTREQAEEILSRQADDDGGMITPMDEEPAPRRGRSRQSSPQVREMEDEQMPL